MDVSVPTSTKKDSMTFALTSPVTGQPQTGLTSPTYTVTADTPPDPNSKQYAVTALGGTQTGVLAHSVGSPFTTTMWKPKVFKYLTPINSLTGQLRSVPLNSYSVLTRKGVIPLAGQASRPMVIKTVIDVPAGADIADPLSIRAALSEHFGALVQASAGIGDTVVQGVM